MSIIIKCKVKGVKPGSEDEVSCSLGDGDFEVKVTFLAEFIGVIPFGVKIILLNKNNGVSCVCTIYYISTRKNGIMLVNTLCYFLLLKCISKHTSNVNICKLEFNPNVNSKLYQNYLRHWSYEVFEKLV